MTEEITLSGIMVLSFEFYFWQLFWNTLYIEWEGGYKKQLPVKCHGQPNAFKKIIAEW